MAESTKTGSDEFGDLLRSARERLGMSRRELAEATGLSYSYISQIETGYRMPSSPAMRSLADTLGLRMDSLFDAIPPTRSREAALSPPRPGPEAARAAAPAAVAARRASPMASPAGGAAASPLGDRATGMSAESAAAGATSGSAAAGGGWIQNQRYASSGDRSAAGSALVALSAGIAPDGEASRDRVIDEVATLLRSVPAGDRLAALGEVQARVVRSVVEDRVRDAGASD